MEQLFKNEIKYNINQVSYHIVIIFILLCRLFKGKKRTQSTSYNEYYSYWDSSFIKDVLRSDLTFNSFDKRVPSMTPLLFKKCVIIKTLANIIEKHKFRSVLEVGSGAGLNLLLLAPISI